MRAEKCAERRGWNIRQIARSQRLQKLQKLLPGMGRKAVGRVANDVGVDVLTEVEADSETARVGIGIVIWDERNTG
jgi:hypothetical protein